MSKEELKIMPVEQELTKEDLKKVNGGSCTKDSCGEIDNCGSHCQKDNS